MTETDPLLAAVEALTKPVIDHVAQRTDSGRWVRTITVEHPPLLQQMHDAVTPSGGNDGNSKIASPAERAVLDVTALYEYVKITSQIRDWVRIAGGTPDRDPIVNLQRWHMLTQAVPDFDGTGYTRRLHGWAHHIRAMLDKPRSFTIPGACPVCGATSWGDAINGGGTHVIKVEYRLDDDGQTPKDHSALCQSCRTVWDGHDAVVELADELNEKGTVGA